MKNKPFVFISSTSDLVQERQALTEALRPDYEPYLFEEDRAGRRSPMKHCRDMISRSDVWVGILGARYGSVFESAPNEQSIVEWEFDTARENEALELMVFIRSGLEEEDVEAKQRRFMDRVSGFEGGAWCKFFGTTGELVNLVRKSLEKWLIEFYVQMKEAQPRIAQWLRGRVALIASGVSLFLLAIVALNLIGISLSKEWLFGILGLGATTILLCLLLIWSEMGGQDA